MRQGSFAIVLLFTSTLLAQTNPNAQQPPEKPKPAVPGSPVAPPHLPH